MTTITSYWHLPLRCVAPWDCPKLHYCVVPLPLPHDRCPSVMLTILLLLLFYCVISSTDVALTQVVHLVYAGFRLAQTIALPPRQTHIYALTRTAVTIPRPPGGGAPAPASSLPSAPPGNNPNPAVPVPATSRRLLRAYASPRFLIRGDCPSPPAGEGDGGWGHPLRAARY